MKKILKTRQQANSNEVFVRPPLLVRVPSTSPERPEEGTPDYLGGITPVHSRVGPTKRRVSGSRDSGINSSLVPIGENVVPLPVLNKEASSTVHFTKTGTTGGWANLFSSCFQESSAPHFSNLHHRIRR